MDGVPTALGELGRLRRTLDANHVFLGTVVPSVFRTASVLVDVKIKNGFTPVIHRIEQAVAPYRDDSIDVAITGAPVFNAETEQYSQRLLLFFPIVVLLIGIIH